MKIQPGVNRVWSGAPAANPTLEPAMKMRWTQRLKKINRLVNDRVQICEGHYVLHGLRKYNVNKG